MRNNVLHKYRSYAAHHLVFMCRDAQQAEQLASSASSDFLSTALSSNGVFTTGAATSMSGAVLMINTMKDANPILQRLSWTTYLVPDTDGASANTIATDGFLEFSEYKTFNFYKYLADARAVVGATDAAAIIWVVKTIFIGHNDSGSSDYYADTEPFILWIINSTASFSNTGGKYRMEFVAMSNGAAKSAQLQIPVSDSFVMSPTETRSVAVALNALATWYNGKYSENREAQIKADPKLSEYKKIRYVIETDPKYASDQYVVNEFGYQDYGAVDGGAPQMMIHSGSVERAIHEVMKRCRRVLDDAKRTDSKFITYKILSNVVFGEEEVVVHYKVVPFETPVLTNNLDDGDQNAAAAAVGQEKDYYDFHYINTGKNHDVLNFNIEVKYGLVLSQRLMAVVPMDSDITEKEKQKGAIQNGVGKLDTKPVLTYTLNPLEMSDRNKLSYDGLLTYQEAIAKHAFVEALESKITIRGNPDLLGRYSTLPSKMMSDTPDWAKSFILCKVNVGVPTSTDHPGSFNYQEPFWYRGFYAILSIQHIFDGNEFRQELELISIPEMENPLSETGHTTNG